MESGTALQYSDYLTQIAALIKQNPSITVREIAAELKFADSKSVYYWLEKNNIAGINEFKRQVLGEERAGSHPCTFELQGILHYLVMLPLFSWNPRQKTPVEQWYYVHSHPTSRGLFGIRIDTDDFRPWFLRNDILVIAEGGSYLENAWVLLKNRTEYLVGKVINGKIVDPNTLTSHPAALTIAGAILAQNRHFSP